MNSIVKAENFVVNLFKNKLSKLYNYHNLEHTKGVVNATKQLLKNYQFSYVKLFLKKNYTLI